MGNLSNLPNVGKELAKRLELAGINSAEHLKETGTENASFKLKTVFPSVCHRQLYALEGAIQGIKRHGISK